MYVASWWAWLSSETGYPRHLYCADPGDPCGGWKSAAGTGGMWHTLASLWHNSLWQYTWYMLDFHSTLLTPDNPAQRHPWESKPWSWPMGTRPLLTYVSSGQSCGDGTHDCVGRIWIIGIPALWWLSLFVAAWALWRAIARLDWRYAAVLVGYAFGYFPWFANLNRQMYFFYVAGLAPFLVIGISLVLGDILGKARVGVERRYLSVAVVVHLRRSGGRQLHLDDPHTQRAAHHPAASEHGDLAALLGLTAGPGGRDRFRFPGDGYCPDEVTEPGYRFGNDPETIVLGPMKGVRHGGVHPPGSAVRLRGPASRTSAPRSPSCTTPSTTRRT